MSSYYVVTRVSASGRGAKNPIPDISASRALEEFGFEPETGKERNTMYEGAIPKLLDIVVRYDQGTVGLFKVIRAQRVGHKANLMQIDAGKVDKVEELTGTITIAGTGSKLLWKITCKNRPIRESLLNIRGQIVYDTEHVPREVRENEPPSPSATSPRLPVPKLTLPPPKAEVRVVSLPSPGSPIIRTNPSSPPPEMRERSDPTLVPAHAAAPLELVEFIARPKIGEIMPDPHQPREYFSEADLHAMAESMRAESQVVFIIVRPVDPATHGGKKFMIIDGERRWRAAQYAGLKEPLVIVRPNVDGTKAFRQSVIANFNRMGHTVRECLNVIKRLLADGCSVKETYTLCGKSPAWYYMHMALENLHADLLLLIDPPTEKKDRLPLSLARKLAYVPISEQKEAFHKIMQEPSARGRQELAEELARPHMAESPRNKPSDHLRTLERFTLTLRGGNARNFQHMEVAVRALVTNRKPEQVDALVAVVDETMRNLGELRSAIHNTRKELTA